MSRPVRRSATVDTLATPICPTNRSSERRPAKRSALKSCHPADPTVCGIGELCVICGETIKRDQLELEIQFARDGAGSDVDTFHVHIRCFAGWELERPKGGDSGQTVLLV
jgi:hypothetical protein